MLIAVAPRCAVPVVTSKTGPSGPGSGGTFVVVVLSGRGGSPDLNPQLGATPSRRNSFTASLATERGMRQRANASRSTWQINCRTLLDFRTVPLDCPPMDC
ncbi:hypothetical protein AAFF_G00096180 [Aldrovandia affinis]|uniref:Uncharacterized protein n=1 Tax=Aldrovandia affinis TaxID=143900 RepID=A0AAD7RVQ7_9TELE|nr:hypothetical protein AAFF_G00096180 [Aldrovandia affinis]